MEKTDTTFWSQFEAREIYLLSPPHGGRENARSPWPVSRWRRYTTDPLFQRNEGRAAAYSESTGLGISECYFWALRRAGDKFDLIYLIPPPPDTKAGYGTSFFFLCREHIRVRTSQGQKTLTPRNHCSRWFWYYTDPISLITMKNVLRKVWSPQGQANSSI